MSMIPGTAGPRIMSEFEVMRRQIEPLRQRRLQGTGRALRARCPRVAAHANGSHRGRGYRINGRYRDRRLFGGRGWQHPAMLRECDCAPDSAAGEASCKTGGPVGSHYGRRRRRPLRSHQRREGAELRVENRNPNMPRMSWKIFGRLRAFAGVFRPRRLVVERAPSRAFEIIILAALERPEKRRKTKGT